MAEVPKRVPEASVESSAAAVEWAAITGGALAAIGVTIILLALGPGLGLASVNPWSFGASPPEAFGIVAGIWLIVTQWLSAGLGGYMAGRLRKKWVGIRTDEVFFRDTAHGFLAWALATAVVVALVMLGSAMTAVATNAAPTAPSVTPEVAEAARKAAISFAFYSSLSFLIGAFIGSVTGALGGYHRDDD